MYAEFRLPKYPALASLITDYAQGTDPVRSLGPHFQRPGRTILERHLVDVPEPPADSGLQALARVHFCGTADAPPFLPPQADVRPVLMQKEMRWRDLLAYFRTWSPLLTYHEKHPEDLQRAEDTRFLAEDLTRAAGGTGALRRFCGVER